MRSNVENAANKLRQYLGTWGCRVGMLDYDELLEVARMTFDVPGRTLLEVAMAVDKLGKVERSARAREAIRKHWPEPTVLWPAGGNARKLLAKE